MLPCRVGTTLAMGAAERQQRKRFRAPGSIRPEVDGMLWGVAFQRNAPNLRKPSSVEMVKQRPARSKKGITMVRPARLLSVLAVLSMMLFAHPAVIAQNATPAAGEVIDPSECQVEPRAIEEIQQLVGTASEEADATPDAAQAGFNGG